MNSNLTFDTLISQVSIDENYKKIIKKSSIDYKIKSYHIEKLTPNDITLIHQKLNLKYYELKDADQQLLNNFLNTWQINQLKLFIWVLVCYLNFVNKHISSLVQHDWNFLVTVLPFKQIQMLKYQAYKIHKPSSTLKKWTQEQYQLLRSIIQKKQLVGKWNQVSRLLYFQSKKRFFRNPQKCRQIWYNHLDTSIRRIEWTLEEDLKLFQQVSSQGPKWARVAKFLIQQRTQHMVKNRYKSLMNKWQVNCQMMPNKIIEKKIISKIKKQIERNKNNIRQQQSLSVKENSVPFSFNADSMSQQEYNFENNKFDQELKLFTVTSEIVQQQQVMVQTQMTEISQAQIKDENLATNLFQAFDQLEEHTINLMYLDGV